MEYKTARISLPKKPKSKIVCILTGNGLKDPDCAIKYAKSPVEKTTSEIKDIVKLMGL